MSAPLGFNDTYVLGMKEAEAERLGIRTLSDLRQHPELRFGFSNEFMDRADGWPALRSRYALPQREVRGLDHDLAYRGLESGAIQVTDLDSTDAEIAYYHLRVLEDDLRHFPAYDAVLVYRADLAERAPEVVAAFRRLPMAAPSILAGIQTSAVINVGTAMLGALIGAGGYGQPILTGIRLDDTALILQGAVPAAVLALLVSGLFELIERLVVPRGLRL